jgi:shikimate kinase
MAAILCTADGFVARYKSLMRRVAVIATASGCGKTTVGRRLAATLCVRYVELDAINHQAGWRELDAAELRRRVEPIVAGDAWVIDGSYRGKLGDLVLAAADTVVWLDLPRRVWLPRLVVRTLRRVVLRETLWNGNRESLRAVFSGGDSLFAFALHAAPRRRQRYPRELARYRVARLRTPAEVDAFLRAASRPDGQPVSDTVLCQEQRVSNVRQSFHSP